MTDVTATVLELVEPDDSPDASSIRVQHADLSRAKPPRWAWEHRVAIGYVNLLIGNEGVGKGTLICWVLAQLTHGRLTGDLRHSKVTVAVVCDEDSWDDVWTPRLHAAGADIPKRVVRLDRADGEPLTLTESRDDIAHCVRELGVRAIFFDALIDNLGADVDDWRTKHVRQALAPFRRLAREAEIAVLGSMHPNKRARSFRELVSGSTAFNAISRSSLLLAEHPDDETRRVLVRGKGNLSAPPTAIEFTLGTRSFDANGYTFSTPIAADFGPSALQVDDLLEPPVKTVEHSKVNDAAELIAARLPHDGDWHPARPILDELEQAGVDERTAQRAKTRLRIEHRRAPAFPSPAEWRWATDDTHTSCVDSVVSVGSDGTDESTHDTRDTHDSENARRECVGSAPGPAR